MDSLDVMVGLRLFALLDFFGDFLWSSEDDDEGLFLCVSILGAFLASDMIDSNALLASSLLLFDFLLET